MPPSLPALQGLVIPKFQDVFPPTAVRPSPLSQHISKDGLIDRAMAINKEVLAGNWEGYLSPLS